MIHRWKVHCTGTHGYFTVLLVIVDALIDVGRRGGISDGRVKWWRDGVAREERGIALAQTMGILFEFVRLLQWEAGLKTFDRF